MIKKSFKYFVFFFVFLFFGTFSVKADETLDMTTWVTVSGRKWTDGLLEYNSNKTYNNEVLINNFSVVGGLYNIDTYSGLEFSFFEHSGSLYNPCGQASFTIDFKLLFSDQHEFVNHVSSVRFNSNRCSITDRNTSTGWLSVSCIVPYNSTTYNAIYVDYGEFTTNAGIASSLYISRYNKVSCSLDTSSIITNDNINTDKIISNDNSNTDKIVDSNEKNNEELKDINSNLTNDNVDGVDDKFKEFESFLDENSTITQLITLPITLYSAILNNVNGSCVPFDLGSLYGEPLILPCINIGNYLGPALWGMIDLIISGFAIYSISKKFIKIFNNFSSMREGDVIDD